MIWAISTAILFAFSAVFSQRLAQMFGAIPANLYRLILACGVLGIIALSAFPTSVRGDLYWKYFLSGVVGFGIGDVGLFLAYTRLGSRLTLLINYSLAAVFAAVGDFVLMGKGVVWHEMGGVIFILAGLFAALYEKTSGTKHGAVVVGILCAVVAGFGQGFGTSISAWANGAAHQLSVEVPAMSQAFQRSSGGVLVAAVAMGMLMGPASAMARRNADGQPTGARRKRKLWPFWLLGAACFGPIFGVSCYQRALLEIGNSAIVVSVAATCTLIVIPLARWLERDVPSRKQIVGSVLALIGVIWLCAVRENKLSQQNPSPNTAAQTASP